MIGGTRKGRKFHRPSRAAFGTPFGTGQDMVTAEQLTTVKDAAIQRLKCFADFSMCLAIWMRSFEAEGRMPRMAAIQRCCENFTYEPHLLDKLLTSDVKETLARNSKFRWGPYYTGCEYALFISDEASQAIDDLLVSPRNLKKVWQGIHEDVDPMPITDAALLTEAFVIEEWREAIRSCEVSMRTVDGKHSDDFCSVTWNGIYYIFTKTQARCVEVLWNARENGTPAVSGFTVLERAGSSRADGRLEHVFRTNGKAHPAWGVMIKAAGKGVYQIAESIATG